MSVSLKSAEDVAKMRVAGALAAEVLDYIAPRVVAGVTTAELDAFCHAYMVDVQHTIPAPLHFGKPRRLSRDPRRQETQERRYRQYRRHRHQGRVSW
jgi:hypothetical protein